MSDAQTQFAKKTAELIDQARNFGPEVRQRVVELLNEARKRIVSEIAGVDPQTFQAHQLQTLRREIDQALNRFGAQLTQSVNAAQDASYRLGLATVETPAGAIGIQVPSFFSVSQSHLAIAQGYTADLIGGLAKDSAAKLNAAIQRAFIGGKSLTDIVTEVGKAVAGDQGFTGLFSPIGDRAESIALNEILRVHSMAAQSKLQDLSGLHPEIKKEWVHTNVARVPRGSHVVASGQVQDVKDPFIVDGEELMYPRDPGGSPENTINCHCLMRPYLDESALKPSARHQQILKDLGISVSTQQAA